ncbi:hemerythrin [Variovorax sp. WS11]|nr:hemerythrin [Variovorax sp. WS11]
MAALDRSEALSLGLPFGARAREVHRLLTSVDDADNARLPSAWQDLALCAAENFAREDVWMRATGHASQKDHEIQHRVVLGVMREGALQAGEGKLLQVREMARQRRDWYESMSRPWMQRRRSICAAPASNPRTPRCRRSLRLPCGPRCVKPVSSD